MKVTFEKYSTNFYFQNEKVATINKNISLKSFLMFKQFYAASFLT